MTDAEIIQRVNAALAEEFELDSSQMQPDARFNEDLGLDSLDAVDMVIVLEKEFSIKIGKDIELSNIRTLHDLHTFILTKKKSLLV